MNPIAYTMPEAKFRTVKKRENRKLQVVPAFAERQLFSGNPSLPANHIGGPAPATKRAARKLHAAASKSEKKVRGSFFAPASWWPVAVGLFLSGFAPEWQAMAAQGGIWAMRAFFPLTLLAAHSEIGMDSYFAAHAPQLALYLQLPLEGLLTKLSLDRGMGLKSAVAQLALVHGICVLVLWLLSMQA